MCHAILQIMIISHVENIFTKSKSRLYWWLLIMYEKVSTAWILKTDMHDDGVRYNLYGCGVSLTVLSATSRDQCMSKWEAMTSCRLIVRNTYWQENWSIKNVSIKEFSMKKLSFEKDIKCITISNVSAFVHLSVRLFIYRKAIKGYIETYG